MKGMRHVAWGLVIYFLICQGACAADGLYAAAPPKDSAFVRFIGEGTPALRGKSYHAVKAGEVDAYHPVHAGDAPVSFGGASAKAVLETGRYYSAVKSGDALTVQVEPVFANRLKSQIVLINLTGRDIALKTADGKIGVIDAVPPHGLGGREVNTVKVGFAVYAGAEKIGELPPETLDRGASYAIVAHDGGIGFGKATLQ